MVSRAVCSADAGGGGTANNTAASNPAVAVIGRMVRPLSGRCSKSSALYIAARWRIVANQVVGGTNIARVRSTMQNWP